MIYAFDVDGVIVDISERLKMARELSRGNRELFWRYFFSEELLVLDRPRDIGIKLVVDRSRKGSVIIITGRPSRLRKYTLEEVLRYTGIEPKAIFMRGNCDYRPSPIVKVELIRRALSLGYDIVEYHDDSEEVLSHIRMEFPEIKLYLHEGYTYRAF